MLASSPATTAPISFYYKTVHCQNLIQNRR